MIVLILVLILILVLVLVLILIVQSDSVRISSSRFGLASIGSSGDSHVTISKSSELSVIKFLKLLP